jgi:hypothetical protein
MPNRPSLADRAVSGLVVFLAEAIVAIAAILAAFSIALVVSVIV